MWSGENLRTVFPESPSNSELLLVNVSVLSIFPEAQKDQIYKHGLIHCKSKNLKVHTSTAYMYIPTCKAGTRDYTGK